MSTVVQYVCDGCGQPIADEGRMVALERTTYDEGKIQQEAEHVCSVTCEGRVLARMLGIEAIREDLARLGAAVGDLCAGSVEENAKRAGARQRWVTPGGYTQLPDRMIADLDVEGGGSVWFLKGPARWEAWPDRDVDELFHDMGICGDPGCPDHATPSTHPWRPKEREKVWIRLGETDQIGIVERVEEKAALVQWLAPVRLWYPFESGSCPGILPLTELDREGLLSWALDERAVHPMPPPAPTESPVDPARDEGTATNTTRPSEGRGPRLAAVGMVFTPDEEEVILVRNRQRCEEAGRDVWEPPGGRVGDEDPEVAVAREMLEETGLAPYHWEHRPIGRGHLVRPDGDRWEALFFEGRATKADPRPGDDAVEARWWPVRELPDLADLPSCHLLRVMAVYRSQLVPSGSHGVRATIIQGGPATTVLYEIAPGGKIAPRRAWEPTVVTSVGGSAMFIVVSESGVVNHHPPDTLSISVEVGSHWAVSAGKRGATIIAAWHRGEG